jgi:small subunit ribosomal protein S16
MISIRLARHGAKKTPFYHITVAEKTAKRDGRFVERLGFYSPVSKGDAERLRLDLARTEYWLSVGAQPTDRVRDLIKQARGAVGGKDGSEAEQNEAAA